MRRVMFEETALYSPISRINSPLKPVIGLEEPKFFLYEEKLGDQSYIGLLCCIPFTSFDRINNHEEIFPHRVNSLYNQLKIQKVQINPILLLTENQSFKNLIKKLKKCAILKQKIFDKEGNLHHIWEIKDWKEKITLEGPMTIADGHHRYAAIKRFIKNQDFQNSLSLFAAVFYQGDVRLSKSALIMNFSLNAQQFLSRLSSIAQVKKVDAFCESPYILIYLDNTWYEMIFNEKYLSNMPKDYLKIEIFSNLVLNNFLQIFDYSSHSKIRIISEWNQAFENQVINKKQCAFIFPKEQPEKICSLSRSGRLLAPNSTFFKPKFMNDLISHQIFSNDYQ